MLRFINFEQQLSDRVSTVYADILPWTELLTKFLHCGIRPNRLLDVFLSYKFQCHFHNFWNISYNFQGDCQEITVCLFISSFKHIGLLSHNPSIPVIIHNLDLFSSWRCCLFWYRSSPTCWEGSRMASALPGHLLLPCGCLTSKHYIFRKYK